MRAEPADRDVVGGIEGRVGLVTGAATGIGRACAVGLARRGASAVAIGYRNDVEGAARTADLVEKAGARAMLLGGDLAAEGVPTDLVERVRAEIGPVGVLVNNAAYSRMVTPDRLTPELWRAQFRINAEAAFELLWLVKDDMIAAGGGSIVNISSVSGRRPDPMMIAYGASKAALDSLTASAALAFAADGIRVNAVAPGFTETARVATVDDHIRDAMLATVPMRRMASPDEIADVVCFLASDAASYVTGQVVTAAGGP